MSTHELRGDGEHDPLNALLMDGAEVDRARIAAAIGELVGIDKATKAVRPRGPAYRSLNNKEKLLAMLLGLKAATLMSIRDAETIRSSELPDMTGVAEGSVYPTLKALREDHMVSQTEDGEYYLSDANLLGALEILEGRTDSGVTRPARRARRAKKPSPPKKDSDGPEIAADGEPHSSEENSDEKKQSPKKAGSSFSQTEKVREMISEGWFDEPRSLADVQQEIRHSTAHQIPLGNLSPVFVRLVRSGDLKRRLDADRNYQYYTST